MMRNSRFTFQTTSRSGKGAAALSAVVARLDRVAAVIDREAAAYWMLACAGHDDRMCMSHRPCAPTLSIVVPGHAKREPGIHNHQWQSGQRLELQLAQQAGLAVMDSGSALRTAPE
jgi:hypothetical protein